MEGARPVRTVRSEDFAGAPTFCITAKMDWWTRRPEHDNRRAVRVYGRPSVSELRRELLIGEFPRVEDIPWLKQEFAVTAVHNLQDDLDLELHDLSESELARAYRECGIKMVRTPIQDGSADAMAAELAIALDALVGLLGAGERVYLHCNAGLNRAPTLAIAYLHAHCGMSLDEACAYVKARRACGPFMTILEDYFGPRDHKPQR
ncbi:MAG TPA: dual specificity protein phosphatase family protein [Candidatus Binataceae bacterium]|nr:dual specificity protein phosphatase family protein [Candidatus Binataceae bacterium]